MTDLVTVIPEQRRRSRYIALVACASILIVAAAVIGGANDPRVLYLCLLLALCANPLLYVERLNGPYSLLYIFMALYFIYFGANDVLALVLAAPPAPPAGILSSAEIAILLGGVFVIWGYRRAIGSGLRQSAKATARDWSSRTVLWLGLILWAVGAWAQWIWQVEVFKRAFDTIQGVSPAALTAITAGRLLHPLGLAMLAYAFVSSRSLKLAPMILAVVSLEFVLGFIEDSKELAMQAGITVLMAKYFLDGKIAKTWLIASVVVVVISFPVFQAYRYEVLGAGGAARVEAAQELGKNLDRALNSSQIKNGGDNFTSRSFLARLNFKPIIELTLDRVGTIAPYRHGDTILPLLTAFLPRYFWPDKEDNAVGQKFNKALRITVEGTYISATYLGEYYWNFGWPGVVICSAIYGYLLGFVNRRCNLSERSSVTRFLVLIVTVYFFCLRFEDGIAISVTVWLRSLGAIGILHFIFARVQPASVRIGQPLEMPGTAEQTSGGGRAFPNLLR